jgi:hypothetical protein
VIQRDKESLAELRNDQSYQTARSHIVSDIRRIVFFV